MDSDTETGKYCRLDDRHRRPPSKVHRDLNPAPSNLYPTDVTFEARLGFLVFFLIVWALIALIPWAIAAVLRRGEGAALALPLAVLAAWAAAILVPVVGLRDLTGFYLSLVAAALGSAAGTAAGLAIAGRLSRDEFAARHFEPGDLPRTRETRPKDPAVLD